MKHLESAIWRSDFYAVFAVPSGVFHVYAVLPGFELYPIPVGTYYEQAPAIELAKSLTETKHQQLNLAKP